MTRLYLKKGREESLLRFHPWVFSGAIAGIEGPDPEEGDPVAVFSARKEFLGWGHYQIGSIAVRMLSFADDMPAGGPDTACRTTSRMISATLTIAASSCAALSPCSASSAPRPA